MKKIITILILLLFIPTFAIHAEKPKLGYKKFAHLPMVQYARVSPDGKHIAAVLNSAEGPSLVVSKFADTELSTIAQLTKNKDRIDNLYWVNNNRVLISASQSKNRVKIAIEYQVILQLILMVQQSCRLKPEEKSQLLLGKKGGLTSFVLFLLQRKMMNMYLFKYMTFVIKLMQSIK